VITITLHDRPMNYALAMALALVIIVFAIDGFSFEMVRIVNAPLELYIGWRLMVSVFEKIAGRSALNAKGE